jgi:hypothetical protein
MDKKEDNIRPPDHVNTRKLFDYDEYKLTILDNTDYHLNTTINKNDFNSLQNQTSQQQKERQHKFYNIKIHLNKFISFDRLNLHYYELILSIIDMYELSLINEYRIYEKEYINILIFFKKIRLPNDEIENFKKIIICE